MGWALGPNPRRGGEGAPGQRRHRTRSQGRLPPALPGADRWAQGCTSGVLTRDALPSSPLLTHSPGHRDMGEGLQRSRTRPAAQRQGQAVPEGVRKCGPAQALALQVSSLVQCHITSRTLSTSTHPLMALWLCHVLCQDCHCHRPRSCWKVRTMSWVFRTELNKHFTLKARS